MVARSTPYRGFLVSIGKTIEAANITRWIQISLAANETRGGVTEADEPLLELTTGHIFTFDAIGRPALAKLLNNALGTYNAFTVIRFLTAASFAGQAQNWSTCSSAAQIGSSTMTNPHSSWMRRSMLAAG